MMSYEEFTQKEAALESAPRAEREAFYAEILEKETAKTDVRMMAYFGMRRCLHYREGELPRRAGDVWSRSSSTTKAMPIARRSSPVLT